MNVLHVIKSIYEYFCIRTSVFCNANEFIAVGRGPRSDGHGVSHVSGRFYNIVYFCGEAGIMIKPCDVIFYYIHV